MKLFLSYSRHDMLLADTIVATLRDVSGVVVERDLDRSSPGAPLGDRLRTQIAESQACFFLITSAGAKSKWVNAEHSWARQLGKKIVLIVEHGVKLEEIPDVDPTVEHIQYDPTRYAELLISVKETALKICAHYGSDGTKQPLAGEEQLPTGIQDLRSEEIERLLSLSPSKVAESLQPYLADAAYRAVEQFFGKPEFTRFVNIGTLETDAQALVIRGETLQALMAAAAAGTPKEYGAAGYRAGVSFGLGVVKWLMEKSKSVRGVLGLPKSGRDLIVAATKIDEASGWGRITVSKTAKGRGSELWSVDIRIERDFLSACHVRSEYDDLPLLAKHEAFWSAYLEGTFSAALAASHGLRTKVNDSHEAQPVLTRVTQSSDGSKTPALLFRVSCVLVRYPVTVESLCREVLCPYVLADYTRVVSRARTVLEGFVREIAGAEESESEDIKGALQWIAQNGPVGARDAASRLQKARNELNKGVHVGGADASEAQAYAAMQAAAPALLKGVHDIELTDSQTTELHHVLIGRG
ncbi:MAG: toll/interleukin-1 receptor domain-containing protein [Acidobacteriota bacterium]